MVRSNTVVSNVLYIADKDIDQVNVKDLEVSDIKAKIQQLTSTSVI